jgi:DNA-binding MarR family transcriptional regulator
MAPRTPSRRPARSGSPRLEQHLTLQVWALADAFERRLAAELAPLGLTVAGFRLIGELLAAPDGLRVGVLAERLRIKAPSVTGMVDRFEAQGLVERIPDPDDARAARVRLVADAGLGAGVDVLERMERLLRGAVATDDIDACTHTLAQLTTALGAPPVEKKPTRRSRR